MDDLSWFPEAVANWPVAAATLAAAMGALLGARAAPAAWPRARPTLLRGLAFPAGLLVVGALFANADERAPVLGQVGMVAVGLLLIAQAGAAVGWALRDREARPVLGPALAAEYGLSLLLVLPVLSLVTGLGRHWV